METTTRKFIDCIEPDKGYPTQDGYLRQLTAPRKEGGKLKMVHRIEWEKVNGKIPENYEINHLCKNRKCINLDHLEILEKSKHRSLDNSLRYLDRAKEVYQYHLDNPKVYQKDIAKIFNISQPSVSEIIKREKVKTI